MRTTRGVTTVAVALLVVASSVALVTAATPDRSASTAAASEATSAPDPLAVRATGGPVADSPAELLACENGTSPGVVACGYNPGPTAVEFREQTTGGGEVTVRAVELASGGFVAVHRVSFVDGEFTDSVVGTSEYLSAGLHREVAVPLEDGPESDESRLIAVVYRDTDGDEEYDFTSSDGADDRPYTNTYTSETGNVTDEAGDVIGDHAVVTMDLVSLYDEDDDGDITVAELTEAVEDWMDGEISTDELRTVITAFSE